MTTRPNFLEEILEDDQNDTRKWNLRHFRLKIDEITHDFIDFKKLAEREGFEPSVEFPLHTLSKRAPSTTRTSLRSSRSIVYSDSKAASNPIVK